MLPVIPLGIHTEDFELSDAQKSKARQLIGADNSTLVVLFMGRLSFHAKAHPLAMYQALQKAATQLASAGQKVVLVECGWYANDFIRKAYQDAAQMACPLVNVITLDGRLASERETAWASADVFCSLSDNIQETFGIVPIEAMASGLPVVVSDWDGYKDTVRDGVDGFRIASCMPQAGLANDLALRHALEVDTYDMYCGHTCSLVSIDIEGTAKAFVKLFESADLRRSMGQAGQARARQLYDWSVVIGQYEALWQSQTELRLAARANNLNKAPSHLWPARLEPFYSFESYSTHTLKPSSILMMVDSSVQESMIRTQNYRDLAMVNFAKLVLPTNVEIAQVLGIAIKGPSTAQSLLQEITPERQAFVFRSLAWLLKLGILKLI